MEDDYAPGFGTSDCAQHVVIAYFLGAVSIVLALMARRGKRFSARRARARRYDEQQAEAFTIVSASLTGC
jgi:hypothetical protein